MRMRMGMSSISSLPTEHVSQLSVIPFPSSGESRCSCRLNLCHSLDAVSIYDIFLPPYLT